MHIDERLPTNVELGAIRRDLMNLEVIESDSGHEDRNRLWSQFKREYDVTYPIAKRHGPTNAAFATVYSAFLATGGGEDSFDLKDWRDFEATDELIGIGDGAETEFPLLKSYSFGSRTHIRRIYRPIDPIAIKADDVTVNPADYTVDYQLGTVTFDAAPAIGVEITWAGEFNVPVRFEPTIQSVAQTIQNEKYDSFTLKEVRLKAADFA